MSKVKPKYQRVLDGYLSWIPEGSLFLLPPPIAFSPDGPTAALWMKLWESEGNSNPTTCEPDLLRRYQQGKTNRDWHISEWKEGVSMNLFVPEEFVGTLGCTADNFQTIFGRQINEEFMQLVKP